MYEVELSIISMDKVHVQNTFSYSKTHSLEIHSSDGVNVQYDLCPIHTDIQSCWYRSDDDIVMGISPRQGSHVMNHHCHSRSYHFVELYLLSKWFV